MQTFSGYMRNRISDARIVRGRQLMQEHSALFDRIQSRYGVQPHYLTSFWALESNFGDFTGGFSVVNALATLAHDPRRSAMFRNELLTALRIIEEGHIAAERMSGSWAGAMGQCQFMPSTYLGYAVDGDGDGRRDIWNTLPDVFASIANYLAKAGWNDRYTWGREVGLPAALGEGLDGLEVRRPLPAWNDLGVRRADGAALPLVALDASLLRTDDGQGPAYLVYGNFRVLMAWNRSTYFGLTVGQLSDLIAHG
jgi:membrane-bound lytic murein transglycosylase B